MIAIAHGDAKNNKRKFRRVYAASHTNRRATKAEMEERAEFLIDYANAHGPVTVRGLYYQAGVARIPGIGKDDLGYAKIQRQVLLLRREGRLAYETIADATRWMRKPTSYDSIEQALEAAAQLYRKALWAEADDYVEVWCEKHALAGVIYPITALYDVPLMIARGFSSETFAFEAIEARDDDPRDFYVYYLGDFDRAGRDAANALREKLTRFSEDKPFQVIFRQIAVTENQIEHLNLPTRAPGRPSTRDPQKLRLIRKGGFLEVGPQPVAIVFDQPMPGIDRMWFRCPVCLARRRFLFVRDRIACRTCCCFSGPLDYASRHTHRRMPGIHRIVRWRKQIGVDPHPFSGISNRPKHHVRFHRIVARIRADESKLITHIGSISHDLERRARLRGIIPK